MEKDTAVPNSSTYPSQDSSLPAIIYFCSICDKPFASESSRDRHIRYCGSRTRNRPRSCRACNTAKAKCSFEAPCSRCTKKAIECLYAESSGTGRRGLPRSSVAAGSRTSASFADGALHADDGVMFNGDYAFADELAVDDAQIQLFGSSGYPSVDLNMPRSSLNESLTLDGLLPLDNYAAGQYQYLSDVSMVPYDKLDQKSGSWCDWMHRGVSLSAVSEDPNSNLLAILQMERPHAQHNADIIIQSLRSFPTMMLRRETFPWFIHPLSQLMSKQTGAALPEALSACMSIAQMFASRSPETKHLLCRAIRVEYRRFIDEMYHMSQFELLAALQACMIYLIMFIVDNSTEEQGTGLELAQGLQALSVFFKEMYGGSANPSEPSNPSGSWEDWIFTESQIRLANLWLLVGCVVCVKTGIICDPSQSFRSILLPSPKSLWETRTQSAWEIEYEATRVCQISKLVTLGDLIDLQQSDYTPSNARKLDQWNAGVDNLGSLLNLVSTMV